MKSSLKRKKITKITEFDPRYRKGLDSRKKKRGTYTMISKQKREDEKKAAAARKLVRIICKEQKISK
jgi:hypothetical protein